MRVTLRNSEATNFLVAYAEEHGISIAYAIDMLLKETMKRQGHVAPIIKREEDGYTNSK